METFLLLTSVTVGLRGNTFSAKTLELGSGLEIAWGDYVMKRKDNETVGNGR